MVYLCRSMKWNVNCKMALTTRQLYLYFKKYIIIIQQSVWRQNQSLFQNDPSTYCDPQLPPSNESIYPLLSLRSSSSFLRLLPCPFVTSISPFIFPSITCFRRQFLRKMWPIQLAFRFHIACRIFLCSLTRSNTFSFLTWSVHLIFSIPLQHHISKLPRCFLSTARSVQVSAPYKVMLQM